MTGKNALGSLQRQSGRASRGGDTLAESPEALGVSSSIAKGWYPPAECTEFQSQASSGPQTVAKLTSSPKPTVCRNKHGMMTARGQPGDPSPLGVGLLEHHKRKEADTQAAVQMLH